MVNIILVILSLLLTFSIWASGHSFYPSAYLGEKPMGHYKDRFDPIVSHDINLGKLTFKDDSHWENFLSHRIYPDGENLQTFFSSELKAGLLCSNETLEKHLESIQYFYRLLSLSYLMESQLHLQEITQAHSLQNGCRFDLTKWISSCRPKSVEMKQYLKNIATYFQPKKHPGLDDYSLDQWWKDFKEGNHHWFSHHYFKSSCKSNCSKDDLALFYKNSCLEGEKLMTLLCSETDHVFGFSNLPMAYKLLSSSHIVELLNKNGEALGCLKRFSQIFAYKEATYPELLVIFPAMEQFLRQKFLDFYHQGRSFQFGTAKVFQNKGVNDLFVKKQEYHLKTFKLNQESRDSSEQKSLLNVITKTQENQDIPQNGLSESTYFEVDAKTKSAFSIAAEFLHSQNVSKVDVDMLKWKYDYVFSLNMINQLNFRLKNFMTRAALSEMIKFDKLGSKDGPVPLLFLKFMIDMEEHQGLWNLVSLLGDSFYVSNDIDSISKPQIELIKLVNQESTQLMWQISILRP